MTVRWTVRADGDQGAQPAPRPSPIRVAIFCKLNTCGFSSFGRAPPCQGGGGGFEPRNPLQKEVRTIRYGFFFFRVDRGVSPPQYARGRTSGSFCTFACRRLSPTPARLCRLALCALRFTKTVINCFLLAHPVIRSKLRTEPYGSVFLFLQTSGIRPCR